MVQAELERFVAKRMGAQMHFRRLAVTSPM